MKADTAKRMRDWRKRIKETLIRCLGGKCNRCGYDTYFGSLDFHHLKNKEFNISKAIVNPKKISIIVEEAKKCILLCGNCHQELHGKVWNIEKIVPINFDTKLFNEIGTLLEKTCICGKIYYKSYETRNFCGHKCYITALKSKVKSIKDNILIEDKDQSDVSSNCLNCNEDFCKKSMYQVYCSKQCATFSKRKAERPSKEELEKMVWEIPTTHISKKYGVSDNAVSKWVKKYGINKPPRGYWSKLYHNQII